MMFLRMLLATAGSTAVLVGCVYVAMPLFGKMPDNWVGEFAALVLGLVLIAVPSFAWWLILVKTEPAPGRPRHGD